jgi:hypothetical protein
MLESAHSADYEKFAYGGAQSALVFGETDIYSSPPS